MSSVSFILCGKHPVYVYDAILETTFSHDIPLNSVKFFIAQSEKNGEPRMSILRNVIAFKIIDAYKEELKFGVGGALVDSLSSYNLDNTNLRDEVASDIVFLKGLNMKLKNREKLPEGYDMRDSINHSDFLDEIMAEVALDDYGGARAPPPHEKRVCFFIDVGRWARREASKKRLEFAKLLNGRLSSDSPANDLPVEIVQEICMGVKVQGGGGKRKSKKKSKRRITKRKYKRKSKRRKSKSKRRRRRSR